MLWGNLLHPDKIMDESLRDTNGRCVFVALAKIMELPENIIEGQLEEIFREMYDPKEYPWCGKPFTEVGVTPEMLFRYAEKNEMGCIALHGSICYRHTLPSGLLNWNGHRNRTPRSPGGAAIVT